MKESTCLRQSETSRLKEHLEKTEIGNAAKSKMHDKNGTKILKDGKSENTPQRGGSTWDAVSHSKDKTNE